MTVEDVRRKRIVMVLALVALAFGLLPVFQANLLAPGDSYYFSSWDMHSQALVLGKIEEDVTHRASTPFGLVATNPDPLSAYSTFDALQFGARPTAASYSPYASSLGLQGDAFQALYTVGCTTANCLESAESLTFSLVFVLFITLIALAVRRSLAIVVLLCGLLSPWVVSSAHNLYWVPWTWLLPACAAAAVVLSTGRRRVLWFVMVGVATAVKASTGYEYLTTTTLLAASVPVLAWLVGGREGPRRALTTAAVVVGASIAGFVAVLLVHVFVAGGGDPIAGFRFVLWDAERRTFGSPSMTTDPLVNASLHASVFTVLARYVTGWSTALFALGVGGPYPAVSVGTGGFWALLVFAGAATAVDLHRRPERGRRNALVALVGALPPLSWYVLAKSHSFAETNEDYVLWYYALVPILVWVVGDTLAGFPVVAALRGRRAQLQAATDALAAPSRDTAAR